MPTLINDSSLKTLLLPGWSLDKRPQLTLIIKATCSFDLDGGLKLADEQPDLVLADEYHGDPENSSLKKCCEIQPFKKNAEFYLFGKAYPEHSQNKTVKTGVKLSGSDWALEKTLLVLGEHHWKRGFSGITRGKVKPLEPVELQYELAYGGQNRKNGQYLMENPAGRGFNPSTWGMNDPRAPRIEYENSFQAQINRNARPAGYGPLPVHWAPRTKTQGEPLSEEELNQTICPLGEGFHASLHHCAPDDQQLPGYLQGGEHMHLSGFFADQPGGTDLQLPAWSNQVQLIGKQTLAQTYELVCDTVVVDTEERQLSLIYRLGIPAAGVLMEQHDRYLVIPENFGPDLSSEVTDVS
ncbi:MAG: DUF2169 domain-containing protein [Natronospirillum sp.]